MLTLDDNSIKLKDPSNIIKAVRDSQKDLQMGGRTSFGSFSKFSANKIEGEDKSIKRESDTTYIQKKISPGIDNHRLYGSLGRAAMKFSSRLSTSAGSENKEDVCGLESKLLIQEVPHSILQDMLFNLCSLYGNIHEIWLHAELKHALVCYENSEQVSMAQANLNGLVIFEHQLKTKLASDEAALSDMVMDGEEVDFRQNHNQRFKIPGSKNHNNVNPPSTTIHLSNLPDSYDLGRINDMFSGVAMAQNISYFSGSKTMALANFDSISQAAEVLLTFHNFNLLGR